MTKEKMWFCAVCACFFLYLFIAARPIPPETILASRWLVSLETGSPASLVDPASLTDPASLAEGPSAEAEKTGAPSGTPFSFTLGGRFGYVDSNGRFSINQIQKGEVSVSASFWSEYEAEPERIEVRNHLNEAVLTIEDPRGYPCFLDGRIFIVGAEQNVLSEIDPAGNTLWTYEFTAPLTCIDAASGLVLTGSVDGVVEVLNSEGKRAYYFEPGGSRYAVITGCAISRDGSRLGIISGIDDQRFLVLERFGGEGEYKVIYHEFLEDGFRRPVYISFIEEDRWIVFEREGGIGVYELRSRQGTTIALEGAIAAIDSSGGDGLFFVVSSRRAELQELTGVKLPGRVIMRSPFKSGDAFLGRNGPRLFVGGGSTLAAFELEKK